MYQEPRKNTKKMGIFLAKWKIGKFDTCMFKQRKL